MSFMYLCFIFLILLHADTGEYQTYFPDILGGGWKLVRRVRKGGTWHPAKDQLRGTEMYGIFADNPQADRTFSRRFDTEAFDQFLFITGDEKKWLVADKSEVLGFYDNQSRQIIASSISSNTYEAKWMRRHSKKEDPLISLIDNKEAMDRGKILYLENKYEDADVLGDHNGANVFIRQRDYKVLVSGCGNFELQAPIQEKGRVWHDRNYMWRSFPDFLEGGIIALGPYEKLKQGKHLDIRVTHPSTVYVMVVHLPDRRNGGFLKSLPQNGWELMKLKALWSKHKFYIFRKSVEDVERLPAFETGQTVMSVVAKRQYVNVGKSQCVSEIGETPCFFHKEGISLHECQRGCLLYEECIGWSDIGSKHCHLFFKETAGVVVRKDLADGWRWGSDQCGGISVVKSSAHSKSFSCFKKKDRKDLLSVRVSGCCKFGPNVPVGPYSQIWNDEKYQFRHGVPRYLLGATLVRGPQKEIPIDTYLKIEISRPSMVYVLVNTDERNGGLRKNLPRDGWTKLDEIVRWHQEMEIYAKPINKEVRLPRTRTTRTIIAIIVKPSLTEPGNMLCYAGFVESKYLRQPKPYAYTDVFPTRESCRYHCLVKFQSQGYSYYTSGNYNECRCGRTGTSMEELMTDSNQELDRRRPCVANDVSVMEWCTCETTTVSYLEKSCYGADESGLFTLRSANIPVYCDMDYLGGKWLLLLTQTSATDQYSGSVSPLVTSKSPFRPDPKEAYSRDWRTSGIEPKDGDEFLIRRGSSGQSVRFVVTRWCGWGDKMVNCETGKNQHHPFLAIGEAFDETGKKLVNIKYFNGCAYGGGCGEKGVDGIGFGSLENHLRATYGDRGYGGTGFPGALRWNRATKDSGENLPYTYWYRPAKSKGDGELAKQISIRLKKEATKEKTYKQLVQSCRADHANKVSELAFERMRKSRDTFETKWDKCTHDRTELENFWTKKNTARMTFWKGKLREKNAMCDKKMRRAKKKFRLKRNYLAGRIKDEVGGAEEHFKRYQRRIEELKAQARASTMKYDESRTNTHKWMKRYFALKRRTRLSEAQREREKREREDAALKKLKKKGPSMDDLLEEERENRRGIDKLGQKYLKGRSKTTKKNEALFERFREEADQEKRENIRDEYDLKLKEKIAQEKAKRLQDQLRNAKLKGLSKEKIIMKKVELEKAEDKVVNAGLKIFDKDPECEDCERRADQELKDAEGEEEEEDESDEKEPIQANLHEKMWKEHDEKRKKEEEEEQKQRDEEEKRDADLERERAEKEKRDAEARQRDAEEGETQSKAENESSRPERSQQEEQISAAKEKNVSPEDVQEDIDLDDLDDEQIALLEKRTRAEHEEMNARLKDLGGVPISLEDVDLASAGISRRLLDEGGRKFDERGVGSAAPRVAATAAMQPHIKYVPVAMPLNVAAARGYPIPAARTFYRTPIGTRVMHQQALSSAFKNKKQHLHGDGSVKKRRKHKRKEHNAKDKKKEDHSVQDVVKQVEGAGKDLSEKKKSNLSKQDDDGKKKQKGPKAEKSGKIFKKVDVIGEQEKTQPEHQHQRAKSHSSENESEKAVTETTETQDLSVKSTKEKQKPKVTNTPRMGSGKQKLQIKEKIADTLQHFTDTLKDESVEKMKKKKKKKKKKRKKKKKSRRRKKKSSRKREKKEDDVSDYGGFSVEELKKLSLEDDVEGKFLSQHHKLVICEQDKDLCEKTKDVEEHRVKKLSLNLQQCIQKYQRVEKYHKSKLRIEKDIQKEISSSCESAKVSLKNLWREKYNAQGKLCESRELQFKKQLRLALERDSKESTLKGKLAGCEEEASMARQETRKAKQETEDAKAKMGKMKDYAQKRIRQLKNLHKSCDKRGAMELVEENERIKRKYSRYKEKRLDWKKERRMYQNVIKDLKAQLKKLMKEEYDHAEKLSKDERKDDDQIFGENLDDDTKDIDRSELRYSRKSATRGEFEEEMKKMQKDEKKSDNDEVDEEDGLVYGMSRKTTTREPEKEKKRGSEKQQDSKDAKQDSSSKDADSSRSSSQSKQEKYRGEDKGSDQRARKQMELDEKNQKERKDREVNYDDDQRPTDGTPDDDEEKGNTQVAVSSEKHRRGDSLLSEVEAALQSSRHSAKSKDSLIEEVKNALKSEKSKRVQHSHKTTDLADDHKMSMEDDLGKKIADAGDPLKDKGESAGDESFSSHDDFPEPVKASSSTPEEKRHSEKDTIHTSPVGLSPNSGESLSSSSDYDEEDLNEPTSEEKHKDVINNGPHSTPPKKDDELDVNDQNLDNTEPNEVLHPERYGLASKSESDTLRRLLRR